MTRYSTSALPLLLLAGTLAPPAHVRAQGNRHRFEVPTNEVRRLAARCGSAVIDELLRTDDEAYVEISTDGRVVVVSQTFSGSGEDSTTQTDHRILHLQTCAVERLTQTFLNEEDILASFITDEDDGCGEPVSPSLATIELLGLRPQSFDATRREHGFAALLIALNDVSESIEATMCQSEDPAPVPIPVFVPAQPWLPGRPVRSRTVYDPRTGSLVLATASPTRSYSTPTHEVYTLPLPTGYSGTAVAVYERRAHRHRWVFLTRECIYGRIRWLGAVHAPGAPVAGGSWLLGVARARSEYLPTTVFALDLVSGRVRMLALEQVDPIQHYDLCDASQAGECLRARLRRGRLEVAICDARRCYEAETHSFATLIERLESSPDAPPPEGYREREVEEDCDDEDCEGNDCEGEESPAPAEDQR